MWNYSSAEFEGLREFHDAKAFLVNHRQEIVEIGDVICRHGFHEYIGVNLLHRHFDLEADERLVKRYALNSAVMRPDKITTDIVPYLWKLRGSQGAYSLVPLEFIERGVVGDTAEAVAQTLNQSRDFIFAIGSKLDELKLLDGFGIVALRTGAIHVEDGEILLETTDHLKRVVTLNPRSMAFVGKDITETTWGFTIGKEGYCGNCKKSIHAMSNWRREEIERYTSEEVARCSVETREPEEFVTHPLPDMLCCSSNHSESLPKTCSAFCCGRCAPETH